MMSLQTVEDVVTHCPIARQICVLTLDLQVKKEKRRKKSYGTRSRVASQSTDPEICCPP
jgi:hypothetical protein